MERKLTTLNLVKEDPLFVAPQGEGKWMGRLSAFIRTTGCNLRCAWQSRDDEQTLCDTPYSSHTPSHRRVSFEKIIAEVDQWPTQYVVLTGGEPSLQPQFTDLIDRLMPRLVTVETNGTRFFESQAALISISPKLASSGGALERSHWHHQRRKMAERIPEFLDFYGADRLQFKFVIDTPADLDEVLLDYIRPYKIPRDCVYLMPQGITSEALNHRAPWVIDHCIQNGFHYSDRLHIRIFGNHPGT